jgi:hypothetical protein
LFDTAQRKLLVTGRNYLSTDRINEQCAGSQ